MRARADKLAPFGIRGWPSRSRKRQPRALAMPIPPSLVALPPMPTTRVSAPKSRAARISSPVPRLVARPGSRSSSVSKARPLARAISIRARRRRGTQPRAAVTGARRGPVTRTGIRSAPRAWIARSSRPSPPSATGISTNSARGTTRRRPRAMARAAALASQLPLRALGAMIIFMALAGISGQYSNTSGSSTRVIRAPAHYPWPRAARASHPATPPP